MFVASLLVASFVRGVMFASWAPQQGLPEILTGSEPGRRSLAALALRAVAGDTNITMARHLQTRLGPIALDERGEGPPLLLLPANGRAAADWETVRAALAREHRTVALDWPAMGASPPGPAPHTASASGFADALEEVVDALGLSAAILLGHSVGAFAAARLAARRPHAVRALVLVQSGGFARLGPLERLFCRLKGAPRITRRAEARFARLHTRLLTPEARAMIARVEAMRRAPGYAETVGAVWRSFAGPDADLGEEARRILAPTLLVWGARDPVIPLSAGRAAERLIPGARLVALDCGHSPYLERPAEFSAALSDFLSGLAPAGARP